jgi:hypothetical protein
MLSIKRTRRGRLWPGRPHFSCRSFLPRQAGRRRGKASDGIPIFDCLGKLALRVPCPLLLLAGRLAAARPNLVVPGPFHPAKGVFGGLEPLAR